jgi:membrane-associated protease RseP (regulator of RpoE activity)
MAEDPLTGPDVGNSEVLLVFARGKSTLGNISVIIIIFLVSGCAAVPHPTVEPCAKHPIVQPQAKQPSLEGKCKSKRSVIGIFLKKNKLNNLEISSLVKNSPAEQVQLKPGDVILKINGAPITSRYEFLRILDETPIGKGVDLTIRRHSNVIEKTVLVQEGFIYHDAKAIQSLLAGGSAVRLAIAVVAVNSQSTTSTEGKQDEIGINRTKSEIFSRLATGFLNAYHGEKNLVIIDKVKTEQIMTDMGFTQTWFISDEEKISLGGKLKATHLLFVDCSLLQSSYPVTEFMYVENRTLVEARSGKTIVSVTCVDGR